MKQCNVCGTTDGRVYGALGKYKIDLCGKHRWQMNQHGKILSRSVSDPNEFVVNGDTVEIVMYLRDNTESGRAAVNTKHYDKIIEYKWSINSDGYAVGNNKSKGKPIRLHRLITDAPKGMMVDHRDHNRLNCRDDNLRICTNQENQRNQKIFADNTSGYKGVYWSNDKLKWASGIVVDGKNIFLGYFINIDDAVNARAKAVIKYFGEFAPTVA